MPTETLISLLQNAPEFISLLDGIKRGFSEQMVYGVSGSLKSFLAAGLEDKTRRPCLIVSSTLQQAERFREDLLTWLPDREILLFPTMEYLPSEVVAHSPEVMAQRLYVLETLVSGGNPIIVAPAAALFRLLTPHSVFYDSLLSLSAGQNLGRDSLVTQLIRQGYERVDMVESKGHVAVRGEIVDVFPLASALPVRLAFWGETLDEIRQFDQSTQRTTDKVSHIVIGPAREFILPQGDLSWVIGKIRKDLDQALGNLQRRREKQAKTAAEGGAESEQDEARKQRLLDALHPIDAEVRLRERVEAHLAKLEQATYFEGLEQYANFFYDRLETLLDYFSSTPLILVDEPARIREVSAELEIRQADRQTTMIEKGGLLPQQLGLYLTYLELFYRFRQMNTIYFSALGRAVPSIRPQNEVGISAIAMQEFHGQWPIFQDELNRWKKQNYRVIIFTATVDRQQRLREMMRDVGIESGVGTGTGAISAPPLGTVWVGTGTLERGFQWPGMRLLVVTDGEVYGRPKKRRRAALEVVSSPEGKGSTNRGLARVVSYHDLGVGDYVVHVNHGIGKYIGMQTEMILGVTRDYLVVKYEGSDRLKIPTEQIDQIQKYIGAEGHEPKLNKLGGSEWARVKSRVKESIREMAAELLRLAAYRQAQPGYGFSPDTIWQKEFEDAFPYEETTDQLKAVQEIKADMETPRPMDRLLLGDVGYGKTEVALRAVFKAAAEGRQVAVLVPTTILAQQHYATCKARLEGFPINLAVLNRFKSAKEQGDILKGLAEGTIEVVIGTHRLLGDDIRFKDLGLLVVDEEQRFGVQHKERIKRLRNNIDVLTLSATPIPRTLHMALVGLREMSVITSPPEDRYPVETYVAEYDEELVRDAIGRELARGGQIFFVHNRIQTIDKVAARIQQLVPEARIAVAHGQMKEDKLEQIILDFLEGEYDALVTTTIIENGIDIPRVNTILVNDSDYLGLSQLYQLRGRVGRSNRLAYAYFLYRRDKVLTEVAEKRLQAIKDFTELGSGFKIAMRDLEIRGAGNILGPEQHGFIVAVGFDLYSQLLEETIRELKGEKAPVKESQPTVELHVDAFISDQYIADARQKIDAYKRIIAIRSVSDAEDVAAEFLDRFGELPDPVKNLLDIGRLKVYCANLSISSIGQVKDHVIIKFDPDDLQKIPAEHCLVLSRRSMFKNRLIIKGPKISQIGVRVHDLDVRSMLQLLLELLRALSHDFVSVLPS